MPPAPQTNIMSLFNSVPDDRSTIHNQNSTQVILKKQYATPTMNAGKKNKVANLSANLSNPN